MCLCGEYMHVDCKYIHITHIKLKKNIGGKGPSEVLAPSKIVQSAVNLKVRAGCSGPCLVEIHTIKLICKAHSQPLIEVCYFLSAVDFFLPVRGK